MPEKLKIFVLSLLFAAGTAASPFLSGGGFLAPQGKNDLTVNLSYNQYTGSTDGNGIFSSFAPGVSRLDYSVLFDLKYGTGRESDMEIILPYHNLLYTAANGSTLSANGLGDLVVIGRSKTNVNKGQQGALVLGLGVKAPTGKSVFQLDPGGLATGTGTWDVGAVINMHELNSGFLLYTDLSWWYRFGFNAGKFNGLDISSIKAGETVVKYSPGTLLKYDVGAEFVMAKFLSLIGELNGEVYYDNKAEYLNSGSDALADLIARGLPDYTLQKSVKVKIITGAKIYLNERIALGAGVSIPVNLVNAYGNITWLAHLRFIF